MMWKPLAVVAAVGSVSLHLTIMSGYSGSADSDKTAPPVKRQAAVDPGQPTTIPVGPMAGAINGPKVKVAPNTYLLFPDDTRIVANTSTKNLMLIDLSIPMGRPDLIEAIRDAIKKTPAGNKVDEKTQNRSVQLEFGTRDGSGQIVLDEISDDTTSASIRIYGNNLFARK